jgi:rhodanese-related sulfurtransferase
MNNLHTKLEGYAKKCDEILLSVHLKELIEEAKREVVEIEPSSLDISQEEILLIDVREPEEFASGYINAKNLLTIPRGKLEFAAIDKIAKRFGDEMEIVTYCLKGAIGLLAGRVLQRMGFKNVKNLKGGIMGWLDSGKTIHNYLGEMRVV